MTVTLDISAAATDAQTRRVLSDLSLAVAKRKKIVLVTGAGISCSCGIPDFRSSDGLYNLVKERYPDVVLKGKDLFDASLFRDTTSASVFFSFIAELKKKIDVAHPSPTHHFIKTLDSKSKLLRSYTQNIDGLEERVGLVGCSSASGDASGKGKARLRSVRNVQLHGNIHRVRCIACAAEFPCEEEHLDSFHQGIAPGCPECASRSEARVARSARALRVGSLRPAIVLYDEPHPLGDDIGEIQTTDLAKKPDMLIIMGTSLKVHGLKKLVKEFAKVIRATPASSTASSSSAPSLGRKPFKVIFVNKTPPSAEWLDIIDYHVMGDSDTWVTRVVDDWKRMRPADWEIQQTLVASPGAFKVSKPSAATKKVSKKKNENSAPEVPVFTVDQPPLFPGKRRQKAAHYDDLESSPSKRQTISPFKGVLPASERKLLFTETTNNIPEPAETLLMDVSIVDLSMQDVEPEMLKALQKKAIPLPIKSTKGAVRPARRGARTKSRPATKPVARRRVKAVAEAARN